MSKEDSNVQEHDNITDGNGSHISLTLSVYLISNGTLHNKKNIHNNNKQ